MQKPKGGKVSGSGGPKKAEQFYYMFFLRLMGTVISGKTTRLCPKSYWEWQHVHAELCEKPAAPCPGKHHHQQVNQGQKQQQLSLDDILSLL